MQVEEELASLSAAPELTEAPVQLDEKITIADGSQISIAQLRGSVMAALYVSDGFAASNLETTGIWKVHDDLVETTVADSYIMELINRKENVIAAEISKICGKNMKFVTKLLNASESQKKEDVKIPLQVEILLNLFNGTIVAGKH